MAQDRRGEGGGAGEASGGGTRRTRDPEGKKAAILGAAATVFRERGYAGGTVRQIARRAGVTHGLVMRHFGSKEELFLAAVPGVRDLPAVVTGGRESLAGSVARGFVARMEKRDPADPFVALIRSAATDHVGAARLLLLMHEQSVAQYGTVLRPEGLEERVAMLGAYLAGVTFARYILAEGPLAVMPPDVLVSQMGAAIAAILDDG